MNVLQRLISNTVLAFIGTIVVKASNSILFILIGRLIGPTEAGQYNLGITYFTIVLALSSWGLHELFVREVAPRRDESSRYLGNYLILRVLLAGIAYFVLLQFLQFNLPYSLETKTVIRILALAIFPEAAFSLFQALFAAHERLAIPTIAAFVNSAGKIIVGSIVLVTTRNVIYLAWIVPISSLISLFVFLIGIIVLFRKVPQSATGRFNIAFSLKQMRDTPGFIIIGLFSTLDFQVDTLLISILLGERDVGLYGAAQTIMLVFWMMPIAIRTALYPLMARYYKSQSSKLIFLYRKSNQYLLVGVLPIAAGICLLARPIIRLIYTESFEPASMALSITIWAIVFAFLNVPNGRLLLVYNRQKQAGWMTGFSMLTNICLNLWLIPQYGIVGAAIARVIASFVFFCSLYIYVQVRVLRENIFPLIWRPVVATIGMVLVVWQFRDYSIFWPILAGIIIYSCLIWLLGVFSLEDRIYFRQLYGS